MSNAEHLKEVADDIIKEFPQLSTEIKDAWNNMTRCIEEGESVQDEEDLFYWYVHKLKREIND